MTPSGRLLDSALRITDAGDTDVTLYEWDHRNRLTKITIQADYGTTDTTIDYGYDVFDRRVLKDKGREVYWVWDGQQRVHSRFADAKTRKAPRLRAAPSRI